MKILVKAFILIIILSSCNQEKKTGTESIVSETPTEASIEASTEAISNGFVYLKDNKFQIHDSAFFPLCVNYIVDLRKSDSIFWVAPSPSNSSMDKDTCTHILRADFQMIKDMGFNSIRVVGIGERFKDVEGENISKYVSAVEQLLEISKEYDLKIIYLLPMKPEHPELFDQYKPLLQRFKDNNSILAYDFFNEPLYFDTLDRDRTKMEIFEITNKWKDYMHDNAPNQLLTIGLTNPRSVFEWDPNVLNVDFVSFHPYEYAEDKVLRDIYWFGKNVEKPWIIGETSLSVDNDSIPFSKQVSYAKSVITQTINSGGIGFSWWQYKDVTWGDDFMSNNTGLITIDGSFITSDSSLIISGTPKPAVSVFQNFVYEKTENIIKPDNYYNIFNLTDYKVIGSVIDKNTGEAITDAVIVAWQKDWGGSHITFTKSDGSFELYGEDKYYHFMISSTKYKTVRADFNWDELEDNSDGISTIDIGGFALEAFDD